MFLEVCGRSAYKYINIYECELLLSEPSLLGLLSAYHLSIKLVSGKKII